MGKIKRLSELEKICQKLREEEKRIGLITGCFDVLHLDHIELFRFAKEHVDVLVVGVENDESVKLSKGKARPVFSQQERAETLAEMKSIYYIFVNERIVKFDTDGADSVYEEIIRRLTPSVLITAPAADKYWQKKKRIVEKLGIKFLADTREKRRSSSKIIETLEKEL